ncbi:Uu.00g035880.m01.CDS01 [Anthostomella pinea]|uniref:Uu.00g035880.m01.CDS01 n=1 Tax=Anthostomella pinea TaxID=933095 RepID=A0AAI8V9A8_9PEZI|nr:Uu.00g035880.m01.CDS01 [Anthostomella pinea]
MSNITLNTLDPVLTGTATVRIPITSTPVFPSTSRRASLLTTLLPKKAKSQPKTCTIKSTR